MATPAEAPAWIALFVGLYMLSVAVSVIGGLAVAEGLLIMAMGDRFLHFARTLVIRFGRAWVGIAALLGIAFVLAGLSRMQVF